ncbi:MAG: 3'-5' exonuclease [Porphyromonadaceae bacterium]|nr:3'-5' exonuclease [Porphyromonadaceae bacterium]
MPLLLIVLLTALGLALVLGLVLWYLGRKRRHLSPPESFRPELRLSIDEAELFRVDPADTGRTPYYLALDTETFDAIDSEASDVPSAPSRIVALSWQLTDRSGRSIKEESHTLRQQGAMQTEAIRIHGISNEQMHRGEEPRLVLERLMHDVGRAEIVVAHNAWFHLSTLMAELQALGLDGSWLEGKSYICTMEWGRALGCKIGGDGRRLYPRLDELFGFLYFGRLAVPISYRSKTLRDVRLVVACLKRMSR